MCNLIYLFGGGFVNVAAISGFTKWLQLKKKLSLAKSTFSRPRNPVQEKQVSPVQQVMLSVLCGWFYISDRRNAINTGFLFTSSVSTLRQPSTAIASFLQLNAEEGENSVRHCSKAAHFESSYSNKGTGDSCSAGPKAGCLFSVLLCHSRFKLICCCYWIPWPKSIFSS